jgi:hypothetical protein
MWPPRRALTAGDAPVYGTIVIRPPVAEAIVMTQKSPTEPTPAVPMRAPSGLFLDHATNSASVLYGASARTTSVLGERIASPSGIRSFNGS